MVVDMPRKLRLEFPGVINRGKLIAVGRPDELRSKAGKPRMEVLGRGFDDAMIASIRSRNGVTAVQLEPDRLVIDLEADGSTSDLVRLIVRAGGEIEEVHKEKPSLEEAFLSLVEEKA